MTPLLSRRRIFEALGRLGDLLGRDGVVADVHIVGGAVMVTEYHARDATADIDADDITPHGAVERAALIVAEEMGLPRSWLNQQASAYVPRGASWHRSHSFDHPHLHLYAIVPEQLLPMKVRAGRPTDAEDIQTLCRLLGIDTLAAVVDIVRSAFPGEEPPPPGVELARDVIDRL